MATAARVLAALSSVAFTAAYPAGYVHANRAVLWQGYKADYGKAYATAAEDALREERFVASMLEVAALEAAHPETEWGWNEFSDWTAEERRALAGLDEDPEFAEVMAAAADAASHVVLSGTPRAEVAALAAAPVDWRERGVVANVESQGRCGSCWIFSAVGNIEAMSAIQGNPLRSLSKQELVECLAHKCRGGVPGNAMKYLVSKQGGRIVTTHDYPYTAGRNVVRPCHVNYGNMTVGAVVTGMATAPGGAGHEDEMAAWVAKHGVLSVSVAAGKWGHYKGGIFKGCGAKDPVNHAVLVVGFTDDAWIVKNSWGARWGEHGYIRLQRGTNMCKVAHYRVFAKTAKMDGTA